jgi:predicted TIM-barrel fold metal-dependent hydrolase
VAAWGSRYPHHDASEPQEAITLCERYGLSPQAQAKLLGGNAARFFGLG